MPEDTFNKKIIEIANWVRSTGIDKELLEESLSFDDVTIVPTMLTNLTSRSEVDVSSEFEDIHGEQIKLFPLFGASMSFMWEAVAKNLALSNAIHILPRVERSTNERLNAAMGLSNQVLQYGIALGVKDGPEFIKKLFDYADYKNSLKFLSIDVAHGASIAVANYMKMLRENFGLKSGLIVGNVGAPSGALFITKVAELLGFESIIVKVGVGPGAACTTRVKTGVGVGQFSAVNSVVEALARHANIRTSVIADGGVEKPADFVKALAAGANGVMVGKYLTSKDFDGEFEHVNGQEYFVYYGMASKKAKNGAEEYVEGDVLYVPVKFASTKDAVKSLEYGLRSSMTYVDAATLKDFQNNVLTIRNSFVAVQEGHSRA